MPRLHGVRELRFVTPAEALAKRDGKGRLITEVVGTRTRLDPKVRARYPDKPDPLSSSREVEDYATQQARRVTTWKIKIKQHGYIDVKHDWHSDDERRPCPQCLSSLAYAIDCAWTEEKTHLVWVHVE